MDLMAAGRHPQDQVSEAEAQRGEGGRLYKAAPSPVQQRDSVPGKLFL